MDVIHYYKLYSIILYNTITRKCNANLCTIKLINNTRRKNFIHTMETNRGRIINLMCSSFMCICIEAKKLMFLHIAFKLSDNGIKSKCSCKKTNKLEMKNYYHILLHYYLDRLAFKHTYYHILHTHKQIGFFFSFESHLFLYIDM